MVEYAHLTVSEQYMSTCSTLSTMSMPDSIDYGPYYLGQMSDDS
jgi:hypothetical protein